MIAKRERRHSAYLEALAARGHDLDRIVRHLDWNMLNQVFVFGYFHADLHPANLFVLARRRHRLRRLRDRRPAPGSGPRLAHPLQLAAVPRRGRGRRPRADALAGARTGDRHRQPPAGSSSASTRRSCTTPSRAGRRVTTGCARTGPRPDRQPVLQARRGHPGDHPRSRADDVAEHRRLPQDAGHPRDAPSPARGRVRPVRRTSATSSAASLASRGWPWLDPRDRSTGSTRRSGEVQRALEFVEFLEAAGAGHPRGDEHRCSASAAGSGRSAGGSCHSGCRVLVVGALPVRRPRRSRTTRGGCCRSEMPYPWVHLGLLSWC